MKLHVEFIRPPAISVELTEFQEELWEKYQETGRVLDGLDWYSQRDEYNTASELHDEAWDALVYSLNIDLPDAEDLVDDVSPWRW